MSTEVNPELAKVEEIFKSLIWDMVMQAGLASLYTSVPALAFFKPFINFIANALGNWLYTKLRLVVDLTAIRMIDDAANENFKKASIVLAVIAHDKGIESNEYKNARETAKESLSKFVRFSF